MLARSQQLQLPSGELTQTPILVPSVSSRGFRVVGGRSEISPLLEVAALVLNDALLVSAYDIHYQHFSEMDKFGDDFLSSIYSHPAALFIDSGGYETLADAQPDEIDRASPSPTQEWTYDLYLSSISQYSHDLSAYLINYDRWGPYARQVETAQEFFAQHDHLKSDLLLKPPRQEAQFHNFDDLYPVVEDLRAFDIIGVTEKELGNTYSERLLAIASLRRMLDEKRISSPIHIFGSLDPLFTPMYFLSGAEIFDGLTWLRYAYSGQTSMYRESAAVFDEDFTLRGDQRWAKVVMANLERLRLLRHKMQVFAQEKDLAIFGDNEAPLRAAVETLSIAQKERD